MELIKFVKLSFTLMSTQNPRGAPSGPTQAEFDALAADVTTLTTEVDANSTQPQFLGQLSLHEPVTLGVSGWTGRMSLPSNLGDGFSQAPLLKLPKCKVTQVVFGTNQSASEFSSGTMQWLVFKNAEFGDGPAAIFDSGTLAPNTSAGNFDQITKGQAVKREDVDFDVEESDYLIVNVRAFFVQSNAPEGNYMKFFGYRQPTP